MSQVNEGWRRVAIVIAVTWFGFWGWQAWQSYGDLRRARRFYSTDAILHGYEAAGAAVDDARLNVLMQFVYAFGIPLGIAAALAALVFVASWIIRGFKV